MAFSEAFATIKDIEGGFSNDPSDSGGATKYGVTERIARANGFGGHMRDLDLATAERIAKSQYWDLLRLDEIDRLSPQIAFELFDSGYNTGVGTAGKWLQRSLNALNREQRDYADQTVDGIVGPMTVHCLSSYLETRGKQGETVLLRALNCLQGEYYIGLSEQRQKDEKYVYGWLANRVEII